MTRKRILLIDPDEALVRQVTQAAAERGFDAQSTGSSTDAYDLARAERPDLIVVNVELAPSTGWTLCSKLKRDEELKSTPIILTSETASQDAFEKHKKLRARADEYLLKPYRPEDLLYLARGLVGLPEGAEAPAADADEPLGFEMALDGEAELIPVSGDEPMGVDTPADDTGFAPELVSLDEEAIDIPTDLPIEAEGEEIELPADGSEPPPHAFPVPPVASPNFEAAPASATAGERPPMPEDAEPSAPLARAELPVLDGGAEDLEVSSLMEQRGSAPAFGEPVDSLGEAALLASENGLDPFRVPPTPEELAAFEASYPAPPTESAAGSSEGYGYEEAPLEIEAAESSTPGPASFEESGLPLGTEDFSERTLATAVEPPADAVRVELEARVAELQAQLDARREDDARQESELDQLRADAVAQRREIVLLRDQLNGKDRELVDLRERERQEVAEASRQRDERVRREAAYRTVTQKAEALAQQAARLSKELLRVREELKAAGAQKDQLAQAEERLAAKQAEVEALQEALARGKDDQDQARAEVERLEAEIHGRRLAADQTAATLAALQERLTAAEERASHHEALARTHEQALGRTREALKDLLGGLGE